jgi:hypothetical protein
MDILGKIRDWLTLGAVPLMGVAVATGIVLFGLKAFLQTIGLDSVVAVIRPYLGGHEGLVMLLNAAEALAGRDNSVGYWLNKLWDGIGDWRS